MIKLKITFVLTLLFVVQSCDKKSEVVEIDLGYSIEEGFFRFRSINDYVKLYQKLSFMTEENLKNWNLSLGFRTLETMYNENYIESYNKVFDENGEEDYVFNTERLNPVLASIFNENGIMVVADTIWKIKDEHLFLVLNGDFSVIKKIDQGEKLDNNVVKRKHTISIEPQFESGHDEMNKVNTSDRTLVFYTSSTTREFVRFEAYESAGVLFFELNGRMQTRKFLTGWISSSYSPLVYGRINVVGNIGGNSINTNNSNVYDASRIYQTFWVGMGTTRFPFSLNVTFNYKKTDSIAYTGSWGSSGVQHTTEDVFTKFYDHLMN